MSAISPPSMMTQPVTLWYWVHGTSLKAYPIQASLDITTQALGDRIREAVSQRRHRPFIEDIDLYRNPHGHVNIACDYIDDLGQLSISQLDGPLPLAQTLAAIFTPEPKENHLHLVVVPQGTLDLQCWLRGTAPIDCFSVETSMNTSIDDLKNAIKVTAFGDVQAPLHCVELYKITTYEDAELHVNLKTPGSGQRLKRDELMAKLVDDVPFCRSPYIVVEVSRGRRKYERLPDWDVAERASKKPKISPSTFGASDYYNCQLDPENRIIDYRIAEKIEDQPSINTPPSINAPDMKLPPLEVLYSGFGEFLDTYRAETRGQGVGVRGSGFVREEVEMFAEHMARVYKSEDSRRANGLKHLNRIFYNFPRPVIRPTRVDKPPTVGHYVCGPYEIPCLFVEFGNEDAGSKAIPAVQLASYYQRSVGNVKKECGELIYCSRFPALGMTIVGPVVTFYAMAWVGSVVIVPLTSGLSCVSWAAGGDDRRALHGAFIAAANLVFQIVNDAGKFSNHSPGPRLLDPLFPDITELPSFPDSQNSVKFQITDVMQSRPDRILYRAKSIPPAGDVGSELVVKITRSYSTALHHFCASRGHAPAIRGFKTFPGDIFVVAMEYLEGDHLGPEGSQEFRNKLAEQLKQLVKAFHLADFVHGDLRLPNLYCVGDKVMLLDFDWGGKIGAACYPRQILNPMLSKGRDMDDLRITKEDDERVLKTTLESIGCT